MATLYELPRGTLENTANVLRAIADEIDTGKYGPVIASILVLEGDNIETFGSGCADLARGVLLLELGKATLLRKRLGNGNGNGNG